MTDLLRCRKCGENPATERVHFVGGIVRTYCLECYSEAVAIAKRETDLRYPPSDLETGS